MSLPDAAGAGDLDRVKDLLDGGADIEAKDGGGYTAVIYAAKEGHLSVVEYLVDRGANIEAKGGFWGMTAVMWAARNGHLSVVEYLVGRGADIEAKNNDGKTALDWARSQGHSAIVKFLEGVPAMRRSRAAVAAATSTVQAELDECRAHAARIEADLITAKEELTKRDEHGASLQAQLIACQAKARADLTKCREHGASLQAQLSECQAKYKADLTKCHEHGAFLQAELTACQATCKAALEASKASAKAAETAASESASQLKAAQKKIADLGEQLKTSKEQLDDAKHESTAVTAEAERAAAAARSEADVAKSQLQASTSNQAAISSMMETMAKFLVLAGNEAAAARLSAQSAASASSGGSESSEPEWLQSSLGAATEGIQAAMASQQQQAHQLSSVRLQNQGLKAAVESVAPPSKPARHTKAITAATSLVKERLLWNHREQLLCISATSDTAVELSPGSGTVLVTNPITSVEIHSGWLMPQGGLIAAAASAVGSSHILSGSARRDDGIPVVMKLFRSGAIGDSMNKKLTAELYLMQQLYDCSRIVTMYGQCGRVVSQGAICQALVMEAGGAVMAMPDWALEHGVTSGSIHDISNAVRQALSVSADTCLSSAVSELGKPEDCGGLKLCYDGGSGTIEDALGGAGAADINSLLGTAVTVCRSVDDLRFNIWSAARQLRESTTLGEAVMAYLETCAVSALPEGADDIDDLSISDMHTILCWHLLPLRRRLELCREMAWGIAEVHVGGCLPAGAEMWSADEARAWWTSNMSGVAAGDASAAASAADTAALSSSSGSGAVQRGFVHRDIKPDNLFVFPHFKIKVGDLGEAKREAEATIATAASKGRPVPRGTVEYISPEMWECRKPAMDMSPVDVYSLGMSMVPLVSMGEKSPWSRRLHVDSIASDATEARVKEWVTSGERPSWKDDLTCWERGEGVKCVSDKAVVVEWWSLMERCWDHDASMRPSALEVGCGLSDLLKKLI